MLISNVQVNTFPFVCFEYEVDNIKLSFKACDVEFVIKILL